LHLTGYEGMELWLMQSRNGLSYEIRNQPN
jgi:hypothetical protein